RLDVGRHHPLAQGGLAPDPEGREVGGAGRGHTAPRVADARGGGNRYSPRSRSSTARETNRSARVRSHVRPPRVMDVSVPSFRSNLSIRSNLCSRLGFRTSSVYGIRRDPSTIVMTRG